MYQNFIIPYLYDAQHVSGDTPPIVRSLNLHWQPLVLHTWKVVGTLCGWQRPPPTRPTTFHVCKTRGCQCSFRLLTMDGVSPETCWASYKYGIIKILIHFCVLLAFPLWINNKTLCIFSITWCISYYPHFTHISEIIKNFMLEIIHALERKIHEFSTAPFCICSLHLWKYSERSK